MRPMIRTAFMAFVLTMGVFAPVQAQTSADLTRATVGQGALDPNCTPGTAGRATTIPPAELKQIEGLCSGKNYRSLTDCYNCEIKKICN